MPREIKKKVKAVSIGRPPSRKSGTATKMFAVSPGCSIGGFDGIRKFGGDMIELSKKQAEYFVKLKAIVIELEDFDTEVTNGKDDKPAPDVDKRKASSKNKAEGDGDTSSGKSSGTSAL